MIKIHRQKKYIISYDEDLPYIDNMNGCYLLKEEWEEVKENIDEFYKVYSNEVIQNSNEEFEKYRIETMPKGFFKKTKRPNKPSNLYVVKAGDFYKIGVTSSLEGRLKTIQTGNPNKVELIKSFYIYNCSEMERNLHKKFNEFRQIGEWFDLSQNDLVFIDKYLKEYGDFNE